LYCSSLTFSTSRRLCHPAPLELQCALSPRSGSRHANPNELAEPDFVYRAFSALHSTKTSRDDQHLPERMRMPGRSRAAVRSSRFRRLHLGD